MLRNKLFQFVFDLLFPVFCVGCKKEGGFLCEQCKASIIIKRVPEHPQKKHGIKLLYAATEYRSRIMRELIAQYKYAFAREITRDLVAILMTHLEYTKFQKDEECIITAVPLHKKRLRWRGFNQADCIARQIAQRLAIPHHPDILTRVKNTVPQIEMTQRAQRIENIKGAFACADATAIKRKTVILIDDVATTGATLSECAVTLKRAGAKSVIAFVIAK